MPNNPDKKNMLDKQFNKPGSQQGKHGSSTGDQSGMKGGQSSKQGGKSEPNQGVQYSEGTDDEALDRGRRTESTNDPSKKWSPTSGSDDF